MDTIELGSYAKINLTLDVLGILDSGYHEVEMIMHQISLRDDVRIGWEEGGDSFLINIEMNRDDLPVNRENLAWRAAELMAGRYGQERKGTLHIDIEKHIPVAAGLAGGSGNCAAVIHALNLLWDLGLSLEELCRTGGELGSDVPFCIMGQAAANDVLRDIFGEDPLCCHCALATGTGTDMEPLEGIDMPLVLSNPGIAVSTPEVYRGYDEDPAEVHPDTGAMMEAMKKNDLSIMKENMINVLENYTLKKYDKVMYTKNNMIHLCPGGAVLMSGSGPTVFALCRDGAEAQSVYEGMKGKDAVFMARTTVHI